jgi:hypothetical protein
MSTYGSSRRLVLAPPLLLFLICLSVLAGSATPSDLRTDSHTALQASPTSEAPSLSKSVPHSAISTLDRSARNYAFTEYEVSFNATGLRAGTMWTATLNGTVRDSTSSSIVFMELNGTYEYKIGSPTGYWATPSAGTVQVSGVGVDDAITFSNAYSVTTTESGLPTGAQWYFNVSGESSVMSTSTTAVIDLGNGSYNYTLGSSNKLFGPSPGTGTFTVSGAARSLSAEFVPTTYVVVFKQSGLPLHTQWNVTVTPVSGPSNTMNSTGGTIRFNETNGSYSYVIGNIGGYHISSGMYSGILVVNGASPTNVTTSWTQVKYSVKFTETGLPLGTDWSVTIGTETKSSGGSSISFNLPNGTYSFTIIAAGYTATTVPTSPLTLSGPFSDPVLVTFPLPPAAKSGLPIVDYIAAGVVAALLAIALAVFLVLRRRKAPPARPLPRAPSGTKVESVHAPNTAEGTPTPPPGS